MASNQKFPDAPVELPGNDRSCTCVVRSNFHATRLAPATVNTMRFRVCNTGTDMPAGMMQNSGRFRAESGHIIALISGLLIVSRETAALQPFGCRSVEWFRILLQNRSFHHRSSGNWRCAVQGKLVRSSRLSASRPSDPLVKANLGKNKRKRRRRHALDTPGLTERFRPGSMKLVRQFT